MEYQPRTERLEMYIAEVHMSCPDGFPWWALEGKYFTAEEAYNAADEIRGAGLIAHITWIDRNYG